MKNIENKLNKVCGFYVNDWHLTTMILPYISKRLKENVSITTILENGISKNIEEILSKMNLNSNTEEKILSINWTSQSTCKYSKIKEEIETKYKNQDKIDIIISGTKEYIEIANKNLFKVVQQIKEKQITIINCYEIAGQNNIKEILDKHEFVLNTSGIRKVEEAFKDYKRPDNYEIAN